MNFDMVKIGVLVLLSLALLACDDSEVMEIEPEEKIERLEVEVQELEGKIEELDLAFQDVMAAVFKLGFEIEDFSSENWKTNVPDVEYYFEELKRIAGEMGRKL